MRAIAIFLSCLWAFSSGAEAASFVVRAGEHPGFTRIVLSTTTPVNWQFLEEDSAIRFDAGETSQFNLSFLFDRIPRTRVVSASPTQSGQSLMFELGCDCEIITSQERPGLYVLDVVDRSIQTDASLRTNGIQPQGPTPNTLPPALPQLPAMEIGTALARRLGPEPEPHAISNLPSTDQLARPLAEAIGRGILEPNGSDPENTAALLTPSRPGSAPALSPNVVVTRELGSDTDQPNRSEQTQRRCSEATALDEIFELQPQPFADHHAALMQRMYLEFDQIDPQVYLELARLYLRFGFGAEARSLIENSPNSIPGRDLLLGTSDILEGRNSNSRFRLSQIIDCEGVSGILAVIAGANERDILDSAPQIAMQFGLLNPEIQPALGVDLATRLLDAGAIDEARVVIETLRRSEWQDASGLVLLDARLDRHRGQDDLALSRLEFHEMQDPQGLLERIELALETGQALPEDLTQSALSLANSLQGTAQGVLLLETLLAAQIQDQEFELAFETLDSLGSWHSQEPRISTQIYENRSLIWTTLAAHGSDHEFVSLVLRRDDWQGSQLKESARTALIERLNGLGMAAAVTQIIPAEHATESSEVESPQDTPGADQQVRSDLPGHERIAPDGGRTQVIETPTRTDGPIALDVPQNSTPTGPPIAGNLPEAGPGNTEAEQTDRQPTRTEELEAPSRPDQPPDRGLHSSGEEPERPQVLSENPEPALGLIAQSHALLEQSAAMRAEFSALLRAGSDDQ